MPARRFDLGVVLGLLLGSLLGRRRQVEDLEQELVTDLGLENRSAGRWSRVISRSLLDVVDDVSTWNRFTLPVSSSKRASISRLFEHAWPPASDRLLHRLDEDLLIEALLATDLLDDVVQRHASLHVFTFAKASSRELRNEVRLRDVGEGNGVGPTVHLEVDHGGVFAGDHGQAATKLATGGGAVGAFDGGPGLEAHLAAEEALVVPLPDQGTVEARRADLEAVVAGRHLVDLEGRTEVPAHRLAVGEETP
jgi:hypothetical protein